MTETTIDDDAVESMSALLCEEIAALEAGRFDKVEDLRPEKEALAERLAAAEGADPGELTSDQRTALAELRDLAARDAELLDRIRVATEEVAAALGRARDRHTLGGLYGKAGEKVSRNGAPRGSLDRSV